MPSPIQLPVKQEQQPRAIRWATPLLLAAVWPLAMSGLARLWPAPAAVLAPLPPRHQAAAAPAVPAQLTGPVAERSERSFWADPSPAQVRFKIIIPAEEGAEPGQAPQDAERAAAKLPEAAQAGGASP